MTRLTKLQTSQIERAMKRADSALLLPAEGTPANAIAVTGALDGLVGTGLAMHVAAPDLESAEAGRFVLTEAGRMAVTTAKNASAEGAASLPRGSPAPGGKLGAVLKAIGRKRGATIAELSEATGWQPHTTRAALTRLRQRGYPAALTEEGGRKAYRLQG